MRSLTPWEDDYYLPPNYGWTSNPYDVFQDKSIRIDLKRKPWYEEQWKESNQKYRPLSRVNWDSQLFM